MFKQEFEPHYRKAQAWGRQHFREGIHAFQTGSDRAGTPVGGPPAGGGNGHQRGLRDRVYRAGRAGTRDARTDGVHALSF